MASEPARATALVPDLTATQLLLVAASTQGLLLSLQATNLTDVNGLVAVARLRSSGNIVIESRSPALLIGENWNFADLWNSILEVGDIVAVQIEGSAPTSGNMGFWLSHTTRNAP